MFIPCDLVLIGLSLHLACASPPDAYGAWFSGVLTVNNVFPTTSYTIIGAGSGVAAP